VSDKRYFTQANRFCFVGVEAPAGVSQFTQHDPVGHQLWQALKLPTSAVIPTSISFTEKYASAAA